MQDLLKATATGGMKLRVENSSLGASYGRTTYGTYIARMYSKTSRVDDTASGVAMMFASECECDATM
jgi:hypothetical protein